MLKVIKLETLGLILTTSSLVVAFIYFDLIKKLDACTLCVLDRYLIAFIGIVFFIILISKRGLFFKTLVSLNLFFCAVGIVSTIRHIWLQVFKDESAIDGFGCGGGFFYYISTMPFLDAIKNIFDNPTPCNDIKWQLFGLSIPMYTFILFLVLTIILFKLFFDKRTEV